MTTFLHTADWQLGKPFARVDDPDRQAHLRRLRLDTIDRLGEIARARAVSFIVVAGDVFDSHRPPDSLISQALERIGRIKLPVYVIPGNHDHGGPGCLWESAHFTREQAELAPNLRVLLAATPVERDDCILLPCPLLRRHTVQDPTDWLRSLDFSALDQRPRIVLAHGSTVNFQSETDEEDEPTQANFINLQRLDSQLADIDYIALGDWHGFSQAAAKAWYAGTPETDRFPKTGQQPGNVACVQALRGADPHVEAIPTGSVQWFEHTQTFTDAEGPEQLSRALTERIGSTGVTDVVAKLVLDGHLGLEALAALDQLLATWRARMIHLRIDNRVEIQPTADELAELTQRSDDPLIAGVAASLVDDLQRGSDEAAIASLALTLLHREVHQLEASA